MRPSPFAHLATVVFLAPGSGTVAASAAPLVGRAMTCAESSSPTRAAALGARVAGGPDGADVAAHDDGAERRIDALDADQLDGGGLDHGVGRLDRGHVAARLDHPERLRRCQASRITAAIAWRTSSSRLAPGGGGAGVVAAAGAGAARRGAAAAGCEPPGPESGSRLSAQAATA